VSPVWMFEGANPPHSVSPGHVAERRFAALAAAVREHESRARGELPGMRSHDLALYRRLRQILAGHPQASSSAQRPGATGD
jgi:hypothetical protein